MNVKLFPKNWQKFMIFINNKRIPWFCQDLTARWTSFMRKQQPHTETDPLLHGSG